MKSIGKRIEEKRTSLKLSKLEMAAMLGISGQLLGLYESGKRNPKTYFYFKWKQVFNEDFNQTNVSLGENDVGQVDTEKELLKKRVEDLEKIINLQERIIEEKRKNA